MVALCIINGCKKTFGKNSNGLFYNLPKDKDLLTQWLAAINQESIEIKPSHVICSKHFKESDFNVSLAGQKDLKPSAIPSIFPKKKSVNRTTKNKLSKKPNKVDKSKEPNKSFTSKYNLRNRTKKISKQPPKSKSKNTQGNLDHTYSTSKPEPVEKAQSVNNSNIIDHAYFTKSDTQTEKLSTLTDHTYTRLSVAKDSTVVDTSTQRHDEHNYSLNSGKKRSKISENSDNTKSQNQNNIQIYHEDHAYLSTNQKDDKTDHNNAENVTENIVLDLRDHTYSKSNKKLKIKDKTTNDKSISSNNIEQNLNLNEINNTPTPIIKEIEIKKPNPPSITIPVSNEKPRLTENQKPLLTECVLLKQMARQYIPTNEFNQLKHCLFILKPSTDYENVSIDNCTGPTYVILNEKYFQPNEADFLMQETTDLFKKVFNRDLNEIYMSKPVSYDGKELCCEQLNVNDILRSCAVRRRFVQPRYVGDYTITDMDCAKNAKRYYELSKTRMESQKFLIQKLRTQNSRLSSRFRKLSQEIMKVKKDKKDG